MHLDEYFNIWLLNFNLYLGGIGGSSRMSYFEINDKLLLIITSERIKKKHQKRLNVKKISISYVNTTDS